MYGTQRRIKRGHVGIEPTTSPTLKENHTTRPMARTCNNFPGRYTFDVIQFLFFVPFTGSLPCTDQIANQKCLEWDSNPRIRRYLNLSQAPWTARPSKQLL